jgi:hypothetical protein
MMLLLVLTAALAQSVPSHPAPPLAREIARDTYLVPGAMPPDRGPDGNTVMYVAPAGLIAVDTGRHPWHSDAILAFAKERRQPIVAIFNTHWHLDHSIWAGSSRLTAIGAKRRSTRPTTWGFCGKATAPARTAA